MQSSLKNSFLRHLAQTSDTPPLIEVAYGKEIYLFDKKGKRYIDLTSGIAVNNLGFSHPAVVQAVKSQAMKYLHASVYGEYIIGPQVEMAELLVKNLPPKLNCVYFVNSGSEAVEGALKLARRVTGRKEIIAFHNSYHGGTFGALSATGSDLLKASFYPLLPEVIHLRFNNPDDLNRITKKTAAVIVEPVQGEAGVVEPEDFKNNGNKKNNFLILLKQKCKRSGALLIFDEAQTGFGRTGKLFAFEQYGAAPDILCLAKAIGGGMPLGAFISSGKFMKALTNPQFGHITTFGGSAVSCAAGIASLKILLQTNLIREAAEKEFLFRKLLTHPLIKNIRGRGLMLAIRLTKPEMVNPFILKCRKHGLLLDYFLFSPDSIRLYPPLIIKRNEIIHCCKKILQALDGLDKGGR